MKNFESYLEIWKNISIECILKKEGNKLVEKLQQCKKRGGTVYICGNGGSAANAMHIANDFSYGYGIKDARFNIEALPSNSSVISCIANDVGYENIFSYQLQNKAKPNDLVILLSGSGSSKNIFNAVKVCQSMNTETLGIFGFDGGTCKDLVNHLIYFNINDMQVVEELQLMVAHAAMRILISGIE